ncbi:DUF4412 domain-containing protein [Lacihabitans sp. LS3-19]|uniref:DUF4412 domain-containing protein n=1 Tax=Lacihabitans sp. LS3-19 TaxID=2487335 RepID=UPI0020CF56B8|nr:DUF4412 domain-containing protein [Lacihabitans sp. LS3-19]MCP9770766.1 DUF4412 domain-containing protein [Lacihabitans sp. LS3-19]
MKKVVLLVIVFFVSNILNAQETKKTEEDPIKKVEDAFDKAFDGLFKTKKKESSEPKTSSEKPKPAAKEKTESSGFGGFSFGGKPKASYSFGSSMTMKLTIKSAKDKKSTTMRNKYMFADDMSAMAIKFLSSDNPDMAKASANMDAIVMDFDQKKMFTFLNNDGKKTLMGIGFKGDELEKYVEKENSKISVTKTSQTKTIAGYKCDGYIIKSDDQKEDILMWISQNRVGEMAKMAQKMSQGSSPFGGKSTSKNYMAYNAHPELVKIAEQGRMVLGYTVKSDKGDETEMEFEELKPNDKSSFGTGDYKSMF